MLRPSITAQTRAYYCLLAAIFAAAVLESAGVLGTQDLSENLLVSHVALSLPCLAFILHGWWTLGMRRTLLFFIAATGIGLAAEIIGMRYGVLFGGEYHYLASLPSIAGVPVLIPLYWCIFCYTCSIIVTSIFLWNPMAQKLARQLQQWSVLLKITLEGLAVVSIDLLVDPLMVYEGNWTWEGGGAYAGIPIGNFIGWFLVASFICGVFHLITKPGRSRSMPEYPDTFLLFPVIGYGLLALTLTANAMRAGLLTPAVVGFFCMAPWPVVSLFSFRKCKKRIA